MHPIEEYFITEWSNDVSLFNDSNDVYPNEWDQRRHGGLNENEVSVDRDDYNYDAGL